MRLLILLCCMLLLPMNARGLEIQAPEIPQGYEDQMPENTASLTEGVGELLRKAVDLTRSDIRQAAGVSVGIMGVMVLVSAVQAVSPSGKRCAEITGAVAIGLLLLETTGAMIRLAANTVEEIGNYGRLLLPVMTTALAAQGGVTASGAIYAGTAFFTALLQSAQEAFLVPGVYLYLALSLGSAATGENLLKRMADLLKQFLSWCLKLLLIIFTTYLSLTRVVSGTTDAAALKVAKVGMASFVPVVGGILSDASEAVLVSAGLLKNAAGIYGILAVLALFLHPFLKIGLHYLILRLTAGICSVFEAGRMNTLVEAFGNAMALLLAMTAAGCIMVLIGTVCFLKGVG